MENRMPALHILTPRKRRLDRAEISHVLWNKIRKAKKSHTLKCGCVIKPGMHYHSVGVLINRQLVFTKQHALGMCCEPVLN